LEIVFRLVHATPPSKKPPIASPDGKDETPEQKCRRERFGLEKRMLPAQLNVSGPGIAELNCLPTDPLTDGRDDHPRVEIMRDKSDH
jgi:hypothetical protein